VSSTAKILRDTNALAILVGSSGKHEEDPTLTLASASNTAKRCEKLGDRPPAPASVCHQVAIASGLSSDPKRTAELETCRQQSRKTVICREFLKPENLK